MIKRSPILFFLIFSYTLVVHAYPSAEKVPTSSDAPLDLLSSQATDIIVPQTEDYQDRFIITAVGSGVEIIDTETWSLYSTQPDAFGDSIGGLAILANGTSLIVALSGGDLARLELDDTDTFVDDSDDDSDTDSRVIDLSDSTEGGTLGSIVADRDSGEELVYFLNTDDNYLYSYDLEAESLTSYELDFSPNDLVLADTDSGEKIYVSADDGSIFVLSAGDTEVSTLTIPTDAVSDTDPELVAIAVTPSQEYVYVLDTSNNVVWVVDTSSDSFVDQLSGTDTDPITIDSSEENGTLVDISMMTVTNPDSIYGFVSGESGLTVLNAGDPDTITSNQKIIDLDESTTDILDPISLSGSPGPVTSSSSDDSYVYASNGDATISVITEKPYITIDSATSVTLDATTTSFTLTFQSDEAGTYHVMIGSDITASTGTELIADTALSDSEINTDVTTASIDSGSFDRTTFAEGTNRVFIFLEDADGNVGRDAVDISVDRPPDAPTITDTSFGNEKVYITFTLLTDEDLGTYTLYAKQAESQSSPSCPGSLDFTTSPDGTSTVDHDSCSDPCTGSISGLTNNTVYCVALVATDDGGQSSSVGTSTDTVTPERTVGPAGLLGETGCGLNQEGGSANIFYIFLLCLSVLTVVRYRLRLCSIFIFFFILFLTVSVPALSVEIDSGEIEAEDLSLGEGPTWFSFELKGSFWIPTNSTVESFFGKCCNLGFDAEFGFLYKSQLNVTVAAGFMRETAAAVGVSSGAPSGDRVALLLIPLRNSILYRFDYLDEQIVVPYVGAGLDYVYFRESVDGSDSTQGFKFGFHGMGGVAFLLDRIEGIGDGLRGAGIDDVFFTLEGRYSKIDSFKSTGLDLSGISIYFGMMLAF